MTINFPENTFEIYNFLTGSRPMTTPKIILLLKMLTISMQHQSYDKRLPQQVVVEGLPCNDKRLPQQVVVEGLLCPRVQN